MNNIVSVGEFKIEADERAAINEVLDSGRISEWKKTKEFELRFAEYAGTKYCVATNSGTSALLLGLLALKYDSRFPKMKDGAKIITSPVTYVATSSAIILSGLIPVYVDINREDFTLKIDKIRDVISEGMKEDFAGILPVHLMGYPNDMDAINEIAHENDLFTFEDSAQAHGSSYKGKKTGNLGLLADFSFYIAHNIQVGEMGCVTTNDEKLYRLMKKLKANGRSCVCDVCTRHLGTCPMLGRSDMDPRFTHEYIGYNFKTMEFQGALGVLQLKKANEIFQKRLTNVKLLTDILKEHDNVFNLPRVDDNISYLAYPLTIREEVKLDREEFRLKLAKEGVESRPLFGCIPTQQPAFKQFAEEYKGRLPNADFVGKRGFYIGCHQYLTEEQINYVGQVFRKILKK